MHSNEVMRHSVVGNSEMSPDNVPLVGIEQFVLFSAHNITDGTTPVFIHSQMHCVVISWDHDAAVFLWTKDVVVRNFKWNGYVPSKLSPQIYASMWSFIYLVSEVPPHNLNCNVHVGKKLYGRRLGRIAVGRDRQSRETMWPPSWIHVESRYTLWWDRGGFVLLKILLVVLLGLGTMRHQYCYE